jgi:hypothetical protein
MDRRKPLFGLPVVAAILTAAFLAACSSTADEQQLLKKYFDASRMRDSVTLANIATVGFSPQKDGAVQGFSIVSVAPDQRRPLKIKELNAAFEAAKQADDEFTKAKKEYQDKNIEAIDRLLKAERENKPLKGADAEIQKAWTKWREDTQDHAKATAEARKAASEERMVPEMSVYDARNPINVADYTGDLVTREVTIDARLRMPDNQTTEKQLVVTIQRAELKSASGEARNGRWLITGIK